MNRLRTRVRLAGKDWSVIYAVLGSFVDGMRTMASRADARTVLRKIGADGMAARDRGVAPVRKARTR